MTDKQRLYSLLAYWEAKLEKAPDEKAIKWCNNMIVSIKDMIKIISISEEKRGS